MLHGEFIDFYIDGQKSVIGNYRFGEKHGQWTYNYKDGVIALSGNYRNGVPNGSWFWIRANKSEMVNIDSPASLYLPCLLYTSPSPRDS